MFFRRPAAWAVMTALLFFFASGAPGEDARLRVVTATTLLSSAVQSIAGENAEVTHILPPDMCPGHYDLTPEAAKALADADIFFSQGFESWADSVVRSCGK
jgi:zinc transport system substrate-binding protein